MSYAFVAYSVAVVAGLGYAVYRWMSERESPYATGSSSSRCFGNPCVCCHTKVPENQGEALPCGHTYHHNCLKYYREKYCKTCETYGKDKQPRKADYLHRNIIA